MNVFVLHRDPVFAAQMQCDKHVVKMIVESAQMLSTAHRMLDGNPTKRPSKSGKRMVSYYTLPDWREQTFYKAVHFHHPCTVWTMQNNENYLWHWLHFEALCKEYTFRYGKVHKSETLLLEALYTPPINIPKGDISKWPLAMGAAPECKTDDVVESYRAFYQGIQSLYEVFHFSINEYPHQLKFLQSKVVFGDL